MNIEAIRKAAEAALKSERRPVHVYREELEYDGAIDWRVQNQYGDEYASCGEYKSVAELIAALDPATVLELCDGYRTWIPVSERLPDPCSHPRKGEWITVRVDLGDEFPSEDRYSTWPAIYCRVGSQPPKFYGISNDGHDPRITNLEYCELDGVTHWMPLPEPPK